MLSLQVDSRQLGQSTYAKALLIKLTFVQLVVVSPRTTAHDFFSPLAKRNNESDKHDCIDG